MGGIQKLQYTNEIGTVSLEKTHEGYQVRCHSKTSAASSMCLSVEFGKKNVLMRFSSWKQGSHNIQREEEENVNEDFKNTKDQP